MLDPTLSGLSTATITTTYNMLPYDGMQQVQFKVGDAVWAFATLDDLYAYVENTRDVTKKMVKINRDYIAVMYYADVHFHMSNLRTNKIDTVTKRFVYSKLPKEIHHSKYGPIEAWGFWLSDK